MLPTVFEVVWSFLVQHVLIENLLLAYCQSHLRTLDPPTMRLAQVDDSTKALVHSAIHSHERGAASIKVPSMVSSSLFVFQSSLSVVWVDFRFPVIVLFTIL